MKVLWLDFFDGEPCTGFPNHWVQWRLPPKWWKLWQCWRVISIAHCCEDHDKECSTEVFAKCMWKKRVVGGVPIVLIASVVCLFKYKKV